MKKAKKTPKHEPGDIVAQRRRPRNGEILCHNHVRHHTDTTYGANGFRWFVCIPNKSQWVLCPCRWRRDLGPHYANPVHVKWWKGQIKRLGSVEAVYALVWRSGGD